MKFSIITPSYKQADWLKLCLASVADQTGVDVEHIVQDSMSGPTVEKLGSIFSNSSFFFEKDQGMYDAINRGLKKATGNICAYLNCDEQYLPQTLSKVATFFENNPKIDIVFGDALLINSDFELLSYRRIIKPMLLHTKLVHLNTLSCAMFFKKTLVKQGFYFDPNFKIIGDAVWISNLLKAKIKMATLPIPLAVFSFTNENLGSGEKPKAEVEKWKTIEKFPPSWLKNLTILHHRCRKLFSGAYQNHSVNTQIFTHETPDKRTTAIANRLSYLWPIY